MFKVGITGGIGSGKTTVANLFKELGAPIYNADQRAKELMLSHPELKEKIINLIGSEAYTSDGQLNRKLIAEKAFNNSEILSKLNSVVHPYVFADAEAWFLLQKAYPYALKEAALLVETGSYKKLDFTVIVIADEKTRIERIMKRDGLKSEEEVRVRIKNQMSDETKISKADFIIRNDDQNSLIKQVVRIHKLLTTIS
jgi:dephospho-CoA kinase